MFTSKWLHVLIQYICIIATRFLVRQTIEERIQDMLKNYHQEHSEEEKGSHSTEENLLTIQDLRNIFVDDESITVNKQEQEASETNTESADLN